MKASLPTLRICHQRGMYGDCKDASAYVGMFQIGDAHYDHTGRQWLVDITHLDGSIDSFTLPIVGSRAATLDQLDLVFQRAYDAKCASQQVAA